ncbi:hypothetical protein GCM10009654_17090 [Streptomyces hebeiensis]|uniref:HNH endonuclease n=1 Tax=Streptomyces hebeiensis TaxID=229486 RepID=A0ABN1UP44_9ACTN
MFCDRCGRPILPGQTYTTHSVETGTGAAPPVHLHKTPCGQERGTAPDRTSGPRR